MTKPASLSFRSCLLGVAALFAAEAALTQGPPQPACTPPTPFQTLAIPYTGLTSGCSSELGGNPNCFAGETIQFKVGDGVQLTDCAVTYLWQFENGPMNGSATINHAFPSPGTFTVRLTISGQSGNVQLSQVLTILNSGAIPMFSTYVLAFLAISIALLAIHGLR
jgi:hypothetical protein